MIKLKKPNGKEVEVNETSLDYALSLGWKKAAKKKAAPKKKAE